MKTGKNQQKRPDLLRLLVLVPHRDARLPLKEWGASLFTAGLLSAWSFPWVAPLAEINRPLLTGELKPLARALRQCINENGGKLTFGPPALSALFANFGGAEASIWGPALPIELPVDFFAPIAEAVDGRILPLVTGSALLRSPPLKALPAPPPVSFRAAALANMICRMKDDGLLEWKISPLSWLPKNT